MRNDTNLDLGHLKFYYLVIDIVSKSVGNIHSLCKQHRECPSISQLFESNFWKVIRLIDGLKVLNSFFLLLHSSEN